MAKENAKSEIVRFDKEQICNSVKYSRYKDILSSQLQDDKKYSYDEIDKVIEDFMKGKVK